MSRPVVITLAAVVVGVALDLIVGYSTPGYPAALGLGGCVAIILVSKWLGKAWLQKPPDYYERAERERHG